MPFETVRGLNGKVYVPDAAAEETRKHPCRDCYACQLCSDDRCRVCRDGQNTCRCEKLDQHESIGPTRLFLFGAGATGIIDYII